MIISQYKLENTIHTIIKIFHLRQTREREEGFIEEGEKQKAREFIH
jgi:hypothetical protein